MSMPVESGLRQGLHELADGSGPPDLADRALRGARAARRRRTALTGAGVLVVAASVAVPLLAPDARVDDVRARTVQSGCTPASGSWSAFVTMATTTLLPRGEYVTRFEYGVCPQMSPAPSAYAVIDVGQNQGRLTVSLYDHVDPARAYLACDSFGSATNPPLPTDQPTFCESGVRAVVDPVHVSCDSLRPAQGPPSPPTDKLLFCEKGTASAPAAFGVDHDTYVRVTAIYPDGRAVSVRSSAPAVGLAALRTVVTDRAVANLN